MNPKFPSEEQGGYDPIPTHPEPLSPGRTPRNPEDEPGIDELPENEGVRPRWTRMTPPPWTRKGCVRKRIMRCAMVR